MRKDKRPGGIKLKTMYLKRKTSTSLVRWGWLLLARTHRYTQTHTLGMPHLMYCLHGNPRVNFTVQLHGDLHRLLLSLCVSGSPSNSEWSQNQVVQLKGRQPMPSVYVAVSNNDRLGADTGEPHMDLGKPAVWWTSWEKEGLWKWEEEQRGRAAGNPCTVTCKSARREGHRRLWWKETVFGP